MTFEEEHSSKTAPNMRLLAIVEAIAEAGVPITPTEVNQKLGLPKSTIHRLFSLLEEDGYVQREIDGHRYSPGLRLRRISAGILSSLRIRTARIAVLNRLAEKVGETCNIALPDRDSMLYLERVETKWPLRIQLPVGTHVPFYCTASGKMYLSQLKNSHLKSYIQTTELKALTNNTITDPNKLADEIENIRKTGFATDNSEFMDDMIAIAVPVLDPNGRLLSTLSIHAPSQRLSLKAAMGHVDALNETSRLLSALIDAD